MNPLPIVLSPLAETDIESAAEWFEKESRSGRRFVERLDEVLDRIGRMPELYPIVYRDLRRARVLKTPYNVYYRVKGDRVEILAMVHGRRDPSVWQSRA